MKITKTEEFMVSVLDQRDSQGIHGPEPIGSGPDTDQRKMRILYQQKILTSDRSRTRQIYKFSDHSYDPWDSP